MEPNPSVYLRAIRREALSEDLFGSGLASGASNVIMSRTAECLAQLLMRYEQLPAMLQKRRPAQIKILSNLKTHLQHRQISIPTTIDNAFHEVQSISVTPSEADILLYDKINKGLSDGVRVLRANNSLSSEDTLFVSNICQMICQSEVELQEAYSRHLEQLKISIDEDDVPGDIVLAAPTEQQLTSYLRQRFPNDLTIEVSNIQSLVGDNSKDIFFFDVSGSSQLNNTYVMRREPAYNVTQAILADEFELMQHLLKAGIPAPPALLGEGDAQYFGGGFIITEKLQGAPRIAADLGDNAKQIMSQIAQLSAQIHQVEIPTSLPQFTDAGLSTQDRMLARIDAMYARWTNERSEDSTIMESAYHWLHTNVGFLDDTSVLTHGDYNLRNILLNGDQISAILDWELCRVSHPAEDLSYIRSDVEKIMPWSDYLTIYNSHSNYEVTDEALVYFEVWAQFWMITIGASVYSGYHLNKHRNFIFACCACFEYRDHLNTLAHLISTNSTIT